MKKTLFFISFFNLLLSCGYPDIDSVPKFNDVKLTQEELFDLCQLSLPDNEQIDNMEINNSRYVLLYVKSLKRLKDINTCIEGY